MFTDALSAVAELLSGGDGDGEEVARRIELSASDRAALLVAFLDELVYLAETLDLVPGQVRGLELSENGLTADLAFARGSPRHLIKGATYHRLAFEPAPHGYRARVVLDV